MYTDEKCGKGSERSLRSQWCGTMEISDELFQLAEDIGIGVLVIVYFVESSE